MFYGNFTIPFSIDGLPMIPGADDAVIFLFTVFVATVVPQTAEHFLNVFFHSVLSVSSVAILAQVYLFISTRLRDVIQAFVDHHPCLVVSQSPCERWRSFIG